MNEPCIELKISTSTAPAIPSLEDIQLEDARNDELESFLADSNEVEKDDQHNNNNTKSDREDVGNEETVSANDEDS